MDKQLQLLHPRAHAPKVCRHATFMALPTRSWPSVAIAARADCSFCHAQRRRSLGGRCCCAPRCHPRPRPRPRPPRRPCPCSEGSRETIWSYSSTGKPSVVTDGCQLWRVALPRLAGADSEAEFAAAVAALPASVAAQCRYYFPAEPGRRPLETHEGSLRRTGGYLTPEVLPHSKNYCALRPPRLVAFWCERAPWLGGGTHSSMARMRWRSCRQRCGRTSAAPPR